jgi:hypothetical protein
MHSLVRRGNGYGYGYGGYGSSNPHMNYHRQNTESVTTVVTEMNRMAVDDKPCYGGGVQKQACKVEAFQEHDEAYKGAVAVQQKHSSFKEDKDELYKKEEEEKHVVDTEYGARYGGGAAAVKKPGYNYKQHEAYGETEGAGYGYGAGAGGVKKQAGYSYAQEACGESYGGAHHGGAGAAAETYAYDQQQAYKHKNAAGAGAGYGAPYGGGAVQQHDGHKDVYRHGGAAGGKVKKNGYQYQEAYGGTDAGGYGAHYGGRGGAVQQYGYGGATTDGKVKKGGYQYYGGSGAGGYDAHYGGGGGGAVQQYGGYHKDAYGYGGGATAGGKVKKSGYQNEEAYAGTGAGGYGAHYGGGPAVAQKQGYRQGIYESESESESESDESDCEEAFLPHGGVQHSYGYGGGAYMQEKHGAGNLGGVRRYESYESRDDLGGGRRYESSYQSTVQYTGSPTKNRHVLRYGA